MTVLLKRLRTSFAPTTRTTLYLWIAVACYLAFRSGQAHTLAAFFMWQGASLVVALLAAAGAHPKASKAASTSGDGPYRDPSGGLHAEIAALKREYEALDKKKFPWDAAVLGAFGGAILLFVALAVAASIAGPAAPPEGAAARRAVEFYHSDDGGNGVKASP